MDELTLNGENYISSKRAAKITGYTKDYVGQLCREGKITAQLVGRNWYISESSIHAHRFGEDNSTQGVSTTPKHKDYSNNVKHSAPKDKIIYTHDDVNIIPLQKKRHMEDVVNTQESQNTHQEVQSQKDKSDTLHMMQDVWQEWFTTATQTLKKDTHELLYPLLGEQSSATDEYPEEKKYSVDTDTYSSTSSTQKHHTQTVSIHKMPSTPSGRVVESSDEDMYIEEDFPDSQRDGVAHIVNVILMLIALVFFIVVMLNMFMGVHSGINLLNQVSGVSVYTAK